MILKMSSPKYPSTTYRTENHGIMLSNWNWEQRYLQQRSIHYPQTSKQSWTFSLKRILLQAGSALPNPRWRLQCFSLKRRMAGPRLSCPECEENKECLPTSTHLGSDKPSQGCPILHQARCPMGIQQCPD